LRGGAALVVSEGVVEAAARMLAERRILGLYLGRCEYGPRALGARTIMASPADRSINDWLNKRLDRTEFMPFAPVVRDARVNEAFDLPGALLYTARYMTVTCNVRPEWRDRIPAVVHVDGTARPQVIRREDNPTYYDILRRFEEISGLPCAINTSFNAHEEPIINRPEGVARWSRGEWICWSPKPAFSRMALARGRRPAIESMRRSTRLAADPASDRSNSDRAIEPAASARASRAGTRAAIAAAPFHSVRETCPRMCASPARPEFGDAR
jgi:hypothetical protein